MDNNRLKDMNKSIENFKLSIKKYLEKYSISNLLLAVIFGLVVGYIFKLVKLDNYALGLMGGLAVFDLLYTFFKLKNIDKGFTKTLAFLLIWIIASGIGNIVPLNINFASVGGIFYYSLKDIIVSVKSLLKRS
jgi:hypothetical protein